MLGTFVRVRALGVMNDALDAAFAEITAIHALMSFHEADSDVSRLNRAAHREPVAVNPRTYTVIAHAAAIAALTGGAFDITIAPHLVAGGLLPAPKHAPEPDASAIWCDIELLPDFRVRFRRPLWIDLGGIAKGYAVDRAIEALMLFAPTQACVNAGGDLRVVGSERVVLAADHCEAGDIPMMELSDGALASSCGVAAGRRCGDAAVHVDTRNGRAISPRQFVSVTAPRCMDADALTKVVMARGACCAKALAQFDANAVVHDAAYGWREIRGHA